MSEVVNGVLIPLSESELHEIDGRELNYARGMIPLEQIVLDWDAHLPADAVVWVYETHTVLAKNYSFYAEHQTISNHKPSPCCPIPQSYVDCVLIGCLRFGKEFAQRFIQTTKGWCQKSIWNDRHLEKDQRKYLAGKKEQIIMHTSNSYSAIVDSLLKECNVVSIHDVNQ
jgi:hypothetical protein